MRAWLLVTAAPSRSSPATNVARSPITGRTRHDRQNRDVASPCSRAARQHQRPTHNTQPFNGLFSRTTWVSRYQKGKTNLDFTRARDSEWQWHQLGHMQACTSLQTDNHANTPPLVFTGRMPFLPPNQQRQSTEGTRKNIVISQWRI